MAQARTHRDQGSLSSLVYSFFPAPASCQAPLPTVGPPSPCTVSSLPALLPAAGPASWPLYACTSGNLSEHLPNSFCSQPPCISLSLPASLSAFLHFFQPPKLPAPQSWSPPNPNFHCLAIFPHSFLSFFKKKFFFEREIDRNIDWPPPACPHWGLGPQPGNVP
uniref:Uncharacterized protein n=1 Tax=Molossus molossus TaxID=27622 RepID=A0A7J8IZG9_MOLMO|nr:hypothetical protein HJG59_010412 [Molossus molossus]